VFYKGLGDYTPEQTTLIKNMNYSDRRFLETTIKDLPSPMTPTVRIDDISQAFANAQKSAVSKALEATKSQDSGKRQLKPYGKKQDSSGNLSRSRSATKELELPLDDSLMHKPKFAQTLPAKFDVKDGQALNLKCSVSGDPEPQITWFKDNSPLSSSDIIDLKYKQGLATLTINEVFPEDQGVYQCKAVNSLGAVESSCKLTILPMEQTAKMNGSSGDKVPQVIEHVKSREVEDGTPVTLSCKIGGATKFDVVWLHNDKEIKPSKDFQYLNENNKYSLKIAEIFPEDGGTYTCEAFNDMGETFSSCTVVVIVPGEAKPQPGFKKFPSSQTVKENSQVEFSIKLEKEATEICWLKDGKPIDSSSPRHKIAGAKKEYSMEIVKCLATDVGQYTVKAKSKKGETSAAFSLSLIPED